jgi:hypothetical protein
MKMTKWKVFLGALVLGAVTGCAAPERASTDTVQRIKRVAVVSTAAGVFGREFVGFTAFGNENLVRPVPEWGLNRIYEEQLTAILRTTHRMTVVDAQIEPTTFAKVDRTWPDKWPDWGAIDNVVRKTCADQKLDGLFVLAKVGDWGLSVYAARRESIATLRLMAQLALLDCATGRPIAARLVQNGSLEPKMVNDRVSPPSMALPKEWPRYGEWTPENYDQARGELVRLPQQAWGDTLTYMLKAPSK